jgi:hypothetical protein
MTTPAHEALCRALIGVGKAAVARLIVRDADDGFGTVGARDRAACVRRAGELPAELAGLGRAWAAAEAGDPGGALAAIAAASEHPDDLLLLSLALGPHVDRGLGRALGLAAAPMTVGLLLDLAAADEDGRLSMAHRLHGAAPLLRRGLLASDSRAASAAAAIAVPAAVVSAVRGHPIEPPAGVLLRPRSDTAVAAQERLAAMEVVRVRPGELRGLGGIDGGDLARAGLLAAAEDSDLWVVGPSAEVGEVATWRALLRDAHLGRAIVALELGEAGGDAAAGAAAAVSAFALACDQVGVAGIVTGLRS